MIDNQYKTESYMPPPPPTQFYATGKTIFREGDPTGKAFLVKSGKVRIVKESANGPVVLSEIGENGIFGEMSLIDNSPRSATAVAAENTYLILLDQPGLEERLNDLDPFMRGLFRIIVNRLRETTAQLAGKK